AGHPCVVHLERDNLVADERQAGRDDRSHVAAPDDGDPLLPALFHGSSPASGHELGIHEAPALSRRSTNGPVRHTPSSAAAITVATTTADAVTDRLSATPAPTAAAPSAGRRTLRRTRTWMQPAGCSVVRISPHTNGPASMRASWSSQPVAGSTRSPPRRRCAISAVASEARSRSAA